MTTTIIVLCCAAAIVLFVLSVKDKRDAIQLRAAAKNFPLSGLAALGADVAGMKKRERAWALTGFAAAIKLITLFAGTT